MAYKITKATDGDLVSNLREELVTLQPSVSDYATGGYSIKGIGGTTVATGNVGIDKVLFVLPVGGQGGLQVAWNTTTSKIQMFADSTSALAAVEVANATDLSGYTFSLLVIGY
jgi:hypothetical protein